MTQPPPLLAFIPVSGPAGTGEYVRCLTIARAAQARWPELRICFVLNRHAPYAASTPFATFLLDRSPTHDTPAVKAFLAAERPAVAIFDNAGRTSQLGAARRAGARVVFISRRPAKRWKAFRWRWLRLLDQHWIAFPPFIDGPLSWWERAKLRLFPHVEVLFLGAVLAESQDARRQALKAELGIAPGERYVLFAGGGGGRHGRGPQAPEVFAGAARTAARSGVKAVLILGPSACGQESGSGGLIVRHSVSPEQMIDLIRDAHLVVVNGGTTLTQALAQGRVCVSVPVASDQPLRVKRCARQGLVVPAPLAAGALGRAVLELLADPDRHAAIARRVAAVGLTNGVPRALDALARLLPERQG